MKINRRLIGIACAAAGVLAADAAMLPIVPAAEAQRNQADDARLLRSETLAPQQCAKACLGMAETYLAEKNYPAAREACAQARAATSDASWIAQAQMLVARSYLQQRNYPVARQELARLLEMEGLERQLKWEAEALLGAIGLLPRMRTDHPRLFFNAETWPAVKARALTLEQPHFERMKAKVDRIPLEEIQSGDWASPDYGSAQVGVMEAAFVYRVTGDPAVLEKVRRMLQVTADTFPKRPGGGERAYSSVAWVAALDWVWNDLVPPEREALAAAMLRYAGRLVSESKSQKDRRNWLGVWPHYYVASMYWFAGIVLLEPSADDAIQTYRQPLWRRWWEENKADVDGVWKQRRTDNGRVSR